ncbi:MAG: hypothetical protein ACOC6F_00245 [bacterium]
MSNCEQADDYPGELKKHANRYAVMLRRWLQRQHVHAVHRRDLETILRELGLYEGLVAGSLHCDVCGEPLSLDTIQCLFLEDDEIKLCCTQTACYEHVILTRKTTNDA